MILGLATGLVVFIVAITGCCWAFKDEIQGMYDDIKTVEVQNKPMISPEEAKNIAVKVIPNKHIHGAVFGQPDEALEIIFFERDPVFYQSVFINPYTGKVIKVEDNLGGFFGFVLKGHVRLWLPASIGQNIVSYSVLLFLFIIISGLILWWPKNKKARKQRFRFLWKESTGWKRKNFDLHAILGFYTHALAYVLAFTGCIMAFGWFYYIVYLSFGGDKNPRFVIPPNAVTETVQAKKPLQELILRLKKENPEANNFELHYPDTDTSSVYVEVSNTKGLHYNADYRFFDQYTLKELEANSIYGKYKNASVADKVIRMNYDIHVGSIGGLLGKIIAFITSLFIATLPVTGVLLWYGRRKKNKK